MGWCGVTAAFRVLDLFALTLFVFIYNIDSLSEPRKWEGP
jgi:hypothetical protein